MALGDNKVLGYLGPGGGTKIAFGTAAVADTVESRLSRVITVFLTYNADMAQNNEPLAATNLNSATGNGSFTVDGQGTSAVFWVALGY